MADQLERNLTEVLAALYFREDDRRRVLREVNIPEVRITWTGNALNDWSNVLREAQKGRGSGPIVDFAKAEYPDNPALNRAAGAGITTVEAPPIAEWQRDLGETVEKIMGEQSTLLPIAFLEEGLLKARSVAMVDLPDGSSGSGFLTHENLLVTNQHVLPSKDVAKQARVRFGFEQTVTGLERRPKDFRLDPAAGFATSPHAKEVKAGHYDWTIVRVDGDANREWGAIDIAPRAVSPEDRVNIIQHPAGGPKQIALYHNVVSYADVDIVQYYTDTLPGSSGSPVFDWEWHVVALHHSGGWIREPGAKTLVYRNEGVAIGRVVPGLAELND